MTTPLLFSVLVPVYNVAPYLRECVDSVLGQTLSDVELIAVDDGSSDGSADPKVSRLDVIAKEEKATVRTSPLFSLDGRGYVPGFMSRPAAFAPGVDGFLEAVSELDPESPDLRYGVVTSTNAVYLIERASFVKAHVPSFDEAKGIIRGDALADAKDKAFKASVDKVRALAAAEMAKGKPFDAKLFGDANVSTSITFSVSSMGRSAFPDATYVTRPAMQLAKGQRVPGDAAEEQMVRSQIRDELSQAASYSFVSAWNQWNLSRMNLKASSAASIEDYADDGEVPEE